MHRLPSPDISNLRKIFPLLVVSVVLCMIAPDAALAAKFYRWVDESGQVYYSDKVPPEHVRQKREELNDRGLVVNTIDAAKTPAQFAEEDRQAKLREAEASRRKVVELHDQWLVSTYRNEQDLIRARDDKLASIEAAATLTRERVDTLKQELQGLRTQAANHERAGQAVPEHLVKDIDDVERQVAVNLDFFLRKKQEQAQLKTDYDRDLERLGELLGNKNAGSQALGGR
ncbi:MAG: hypothetical protein FD165_1689 [Gammaproteobacteria bacterium]|nr:MAG: hypothetical protein FD165_1689 [Gammaproteobacteria bacterium]TND02663.1 MAG: hypothetical protein FD120_2124 [Gammaproteobacteria bacterium]